MESDGHPLHMYTSGSLRAPESTLLNLLLNYYVCYTCVDYEDSALLCRRQSKPSTGRQDMGTTSSWLHVLIPATSGRVRFVLQTGFKTVDV